MGKPLTCLVVDDSRVVRKVARRILEGNGFAVREAADGSEALLSCRAALPDCVLLDWNMPVMNGIEFLQAVRSQPGSSAFKMLMVTTASDLSHIKTAIEAGANEYLMKPFTKEAMVSKLQMLGILEA